MLRSLEHDGHYLQTIKSHSIEKIIRHNDYARRFINVTKNRWPQRAYIGLYSGAGRARVEETGEIVETSAMGALRLPFTHYVFVDRDPLCTAALKLRAREVRPEAPITIIMDDVNASGDRVLRALPPFSRTKGLISLCFVDPFATDLRFSTIRTLARRRMDFLILLPLGMDVRRNMRRYYLNADDTRIADLIDYPDWRADVERSGRHQMIRYLLRRFDEAMTRLEYKSLDPRLVHPVKVPKKNVLLYYLVLYTKHDLGLRLWNETLRAHEPQLSLDIS